MTMTIWRLCGQFQKSRLLFWVKSSTFASIIKMSLVSICLLFSSPETKTQPKTNMNSSYHTESDTHSHTTPPNHKIGWNGSKMVHWFPGGWSSHAFRSFRRSKFSRHQATFGFDVNESYTFYQGKKVFVSWYKCRVCVSLNQHQQCIIIPRGNHPVIFVRCSLLMTLRIRFSEISWTPF